MFLESGKYYHIYNHANGFEKIFRNEDNYRFFVEKYKFHMSVFLDTYAYCLMPNHFHFLIRVKSAEEIMTGLKKVLGIKAFSTPPAVTQTFPKFQTSGKLLPQEELKKQDHNLPDFFKSAKMSPSSIFKAYEKIFKKYCLLNKIETAESNLLDSFLEHWISRQFGDLFSSYTQAFNKQNKRMGGLFIKNFRRKEVDTDEYLRNLVVYIHNNPVFHGFVNKPGNWMFSSFKDVVDNNNCFVNSNTVLKWFGNLENFLFCHRFFISFDSDYSLE